MYLSDSKRQTYIGISIDEMILNSPLTLCTILHIKGDQEFKNTNLDTEHDHKFDVLNQYQTLKITDRTINIKIVASIANNFFEICLKNMYL